MSSSGKLYGCGTSLWQLGGSGTKSLLKWWWQGSLTNLLISYPLQSSIANSQKNLVYRKSHPFIFGGKNILYYFLFKCWGHNIHYISFIKNIFDWNIQFYLLFKIEIGNIQKNILSFKKSDIEHP